MNIKSINWYGTCLFLFFFLMKTANTSYKIFSHFVTNDRWSEGHYIRLWDKKVQLLQSWFCDCIILLGTNLQKYYFNISLDFFTSDQQAVCETEKMLAEGNLQWTDIHPN